MSLLHAIDDREHGLIPLVRSFKTTHLPIGDIWVGLDCSGNPAAHGVILERKSVADLEASILDGRYKEQRARLLAFAQERKVHPAYIIEGDLDRIQARLKKPALMKHLTRLALRYHIAVFQTACLQETAELCELLADQWKTDPTTFDTPASLSYVETRGVTREANTDDPKVFAVTVLSACRGVSAAGAKALLEYFAARKTREGSEACASGTLEDIWKASVAELAAIPIGKQKFGKAKAERLWGLLHST